MTDQIQSGMMAMMQVMAAQSQVPQIGSKKAQGAEDDFQNMLEQKSQPAKEETKQPEAAQKPEEASEQPAQQTQTEEQPQEDGCAMVKRLAEAGLIPVDVANAYLTQGQQLVQLEQPALEVVPVEQSEQPVLLTPEFQQLPSKAIAPQQTLEITPQEEIQPEQFLEVVEQPEEQPVQQNLALDAAPQQETAPKAESLPVEAVQVQQGGEEEDGLESTDLPQSAEPVFRDVKAAPIKVGEAQQPEQSQKADLNQQIAGPLNQALAQGQTKVEIHLNPEYLGSVKVEIFQSAEGVLRVALTAESSETRGLLEKHAANLQSLLSGREQQTVEVEIQRQQPQDGQNPNHLNEDGRNGQNQQQRQQRRQQNGDGQDFLQKLRLGLAPVENGL
jgi:hypothetical protein